MAAEQKVEASSSAATRPNAALTGDEGVDASRATA